MAVSHRYSQPAATSLPNPSSLITRSRIFVSLVAGLALGVVGWSGWSGFLWYFVAHLVVRISMVAVNQLKSASGPECMVMLALWL